MEVSGTVIQVMPVESFQDGKLKKQTFVLEIPDGKYTNHLAVDMWNDKIVQLAPGMSVDAKVNVRSKQGKGQHAGRWFTNVSAWSVLVAAEDQTQAPVPQGPSGGGWDEDDGLPFMRYEPLF